MKRIDYPTRAAALAGALALLTLTACGDKEQPPAPPAKVEAPAAAPAPAPAATQASDFPTQVSNAPLFDTPGSWSDGYRKAVGRGNGVVVGPGTENPNVFAQSFPTKPAERFMVVAKAASVDKPTAMGRIQINWMSAEGTFLGVSSKAFEVTPQEQSFQEVVTAPDKATTGILYVVGNGADDVVRYTEMRLLGTADHGKSN